MGRCQQTWLDPENFSTKTCGRETERKVGDRFVCDECAHKLSEMAIKRPTLLCNTCFVPGTEEISMGPPIMRAVCDRCGGQISEDGYHWVSRDLSGAAENAE
jgi:hypothetical protein